MEQSYIRDRIKEISSGLMDGIGISKKIQEENDNSPDCRIGSLEEIIKIYANRLKCMADVME